MSIKRKQQTCKPGSVPLARRLSLILTGSLLPAPDPYGPRGLPSGLGGQPSDAGIHDLATSKAYSTCIAAGLVGSCPAFSPLPPCSNPEVLQDGGCFLLRYSAVADSYPLGSGMPFCCPDFPLSRKGQRQTGLLFPLQNYYFFLCYALKAAARRCSASASMLRGHPTLRRMKPRPSGPAVPSGSRLLNMLPSFSASRAPSTNRLTSLS